LKYYSRNSLTMSTIFRRLASTAPYLTPEKPEKIKQLLKPLGVLTKPLSMPNDEKKSFQERKADFLDVKKNRIRREELKEEFAKSSFDHIYGMRDTGGKIFTAPPKMFTDDEALYMPNIVGKSLTDTFGGETTLLQLLSTKETNIVRMFSSSLGQQQIKEFTKDLDLGHLGVRLVDVNTPTSWVNRLLVKWSKKSIRKSEIGENEDFHKYLIASQTLTPALRKSIGASNILAGYLYVVDVNGKIRWATSGATMADEKQRLLNVLKSLKI